MTWPTHNSGAVPEWWTWEVELTPHLLKRMADRDFSELDVRELLEHPLRVRPKQGEPRWIVRSTLRGREWDVVVEPDDAIKALVIVTAYPIS